MRWRSRMLPAYLAISLLVKWTSSSRSEIFSLDVTIVECSELSTRSAIPIRRALPLLQPRTALSLYSIGAGWIVDHHDFHCLLPLGTAATTLLDFYENIAAVAATTSRPIQETYQFWVGEVSLEIAGTRGCRIPWNIVASFASDMVSMTRRGYINTYQINFMHPSTGRIMTCSLWIGLIR